MSPAPQEEPEISLEHAIKLARDFAKKERIDLSNHYLDRVWVGRQDGQPDRRWIVSWSPNPQKANDTNGWLILTVTMEGIVEKRKGAVPWSKARVIVPPKADK